MASTSHSEIFNCSVEQFFALITDYEKYPEFIDEVKDVKILKSEGNKKLIEYKLSVIKTIHYTLETNDNPPTETTWTLKKGDMFKKLDGSWKLSEEAGKCRGVYTVDIAFGIFVPGPIVKTVQTVNLRSMMSAFHKRVSDIYGR